ncbi:MAG TPA: DUF6452 family protein [Ohtaekwangia sp.]|uniref:DUF6452 family protein n=1 Tax=Ohtaekwangia sp. TaxID=2066019 RepID=UPI002F95B965
MKYKLFRVLLSIIFISCLFTYSSCVDDCESDSEPQLSVYFSNPHNYKTIYGLHGKKKLTAPFDSPQYIAVPMSIKEDSTIVIFEAADHTDTLTVHYSRTVKMQSVRCGFRIYFDDFAIIQPTTFTDVSVSSELYDRVLDIYIND